MPRNTCYHLDLEQADAPLFKIIIRFTSDAAGVLLGPCGVTGGWQCFSHKEYMF